MHFVTLFGNDPCGDGRAQTLEIDGIVSDRWRTLSGLRPDMPASASASSTRAPQARQRLVADHCLLADRRRGLLRPDHRQGQERAADRLRRVGRRRRRVSVPSDERQRISSRGDSSSSTVRRRLRAIRVRSVCGLTARITGIVADLCFDAERSWRPDWHIVQAANRPLGPLTSALTRHGRRQVGHRRLRLGFVQMALVAVACLQVLGAYVVPQQAAASQSTGSTTSR